MVNIQKEEGTSTINPKLIHQLLIEAQCEELSEAELIRFYQVLDLFEEQLNQHPLPLLVYAAHKLVKDHTLRNEVFNNEN
jgi:hypothetical protein